MIDGIGTSSIQGSASANIGASGGAGGVSSHGGGQSGQRHAAVLGDVVQVSAQGRAQAQAAQQYREQGVRGQKPDIDALVRQAQAASQAGALAATGVAGLSLTQQASFTDGGANGLRAAFTQASPHTPDPGRVAAVYRTEQAKGRASTGLAPYGTGITLTV